jgi:tetratricopeptide (TPR) repeat protein
MSEPKPAHQQNVWTDAFREFDALYEAGPQERAARVAALQAASPALAEAVQRLLAEHEARALPRTRDWLDQLPSQLQRPLPPVAGQPGAEAGPEPAPERIGPWRLLRELGRGGTSRVWLARREDVPWLREVALKVPLVGLLRQDLRERLVRERDILSRLEHPHIARLYDAGFADAQPWLALEYVQGQDILAWCDARGASLRERVLLFRQVLQAVQYAHSALIVHRDLKPANILVTAEGQARLLDFGIAKLIAEGQDHTQTTQLTQAAGRMLTPAYASPEQLRDDPLTTATDIYSLGLVLYQLLTGAHPFAGRPRSVSQIEQAIMDGQIALASRSDIGVPQSQARGLAPQALRRALAGDLDAVLCKATLAEPAARYASAAAFDADLEAWLDGRPVRARRPTLWQHTVKLVRRHPWASGLGAAAVCALTATTVVAVHQASQARVQAQQARMEAARAKSVKDFLLGLFDEANPDRNGGRDVLARELLLRGEQRIDRDLAGQPLLKAEMLGSIGRVWWQFGDMEAAARAMRRRSDVAAQSTPGLVHAAALLDEVQVAREAGEMDRAAQALAAAMQAGRQAGDAVPPGLQARMELEQAWLAMKQRSPAYPDALAHLEQARALAQRAADAPLQVDALTATASALRRQRRYAEAAAVMTQAEGIVQAARAAAPDSFPESTLHVLRLDKVRTLLSQGEYREAWTLVDQVMRDVEAWVGTNPNRFALQHYRQVWLGTMIQLGLVEPAAGWVQAHPAEFLELQIADPVDSVERYRWLAKLWVGRADWPRAAEMLRKGMDAAAGAGPYSLLGLMQVDAEARLRQLQPVEAGRILDQMEQRLAVVPGEGAWPALLEVKALRVVAKAQARQWAEAARLAQEVVDGAVHRLGEEHPRTARARVNLVLLWMRQPVPPTEALDRDARSQLERALPVLQRCYLPASESVRAAEALRDHLRDRQAGRQLLPESSPANWLLNNPRALVL